MRLVRVVGPALCALAALGAVLGAWLEERPSLTRDDARVFVAGALADAGFEDVRIVPEVEAAIDPGDDADDPLPVWVTTARVDGGEIELWVDRSAAQAVRVASEPPDLVNDAAFARLDKYDEDPPLDERIRRNLVVTVAGLSAAAVSFVLAGSLGRRN